MLIFYLPDLENRVRMETGAKCVASSENFIWNDQSWEEEISSEAYIVQKWLIIAETVLAPCVMVIRLY